MNEHIATLREGAQLLSRSSAVLLSCRKTRSELYRLALCWGVTADLWELRAMSCGPALSRSLIAEASMMRECAEQLLAVLDKQPLPSEAREIITGIAPEEESNAGNDDVDSEATGPIPGQHDLLQAEAVVQ